ncbi:hypothetical protein L0N33_24180, partial [Roseburia faecis]|nr:hypothetical protein [Roseburia faecis]
HQKPVTNAICKWIYDSSELSAVEIVDLLPVSLKPAQKHELAKILSNPVAERLKQTFADVRSGEAATVGQSVVRNR